MCECKGIGRGWIIGLGLVGVVIVGMGRVMR